jgi:transcriptional regulator with XRE-family HTH domain
VTNPWQNQLETLGEFLRAQRKLANLSLRELAAMTDLSNAYLSQIERGMHQPSVRVLRSIADALELSTNTLLAHAGLFDDAGRTRPTEEAIRADPILSGEQKQALLAVYRSYVAQRQHGEAESSDP